MAVTLPDPPTVEVRRARIVRKLFDVRRFTPYTFHPGNLFFPFTDVI